MRAALLLIAVVAIAAAPHRSAALAAVEPGVGAGTIRAIAIAPVWAGHPVGFALLTTGQRQFVAFYDADRQMTVGARRLDEDRFQLARLPAKLGWDSHNYVTLAEDQDGHLHLSGNMHCVPLVYFRTTRPHDVTSFERVPEMVGRNEKRCTYPRFLRGAAGELIFTYRDGSSGNGDQYCNVYDPKTRTWRRLVDSPLFAGHGKMNAYFVGPEQDRAGVFHICWVWRNTPDCATNHDLCYARSKDLAHWERSDGRPLALPIAVETAEIVDPVPVRGGLLNGNTKIGFDAEGRVVLGYHKFDAAGKTQLYNARRETDGWRIYQTSVWDYRWEFQGGGTIRGEIGLGPVTVEPDGALTQAYHHNRLGSGVWRLDPQTLKPIGKAQPRPGLPPAVARVESTWPEMSVRTANDLGRSPEPGTRDLLRWETLPANRDRPYPEPWPPPSLLRLWRIPAETAN